MEAVIEMVENHLMVAEVMVTEMELTKVIAQDRDAYGGAARGGGSHGGGSFMVMVLTEPVKKKDPKMELDHQPEGMEEVAIEKVAVEKLMAKVELMEVVISPSTTRQVDVYLLR
ncbi:hypothetical protein F2Q70_00018923 [Brassica cretica]|uniref:Uncharacterized protein n=1 Tax=Brassica cretica TaxID=69181 RepID=A0A8S9HVC3_BRACR|nr:hypothetical protein F2Q70_00018923 [Brassica cretica]